MPRGFFGEEVRAVRKPLPLLARCGECGLHAGCKSPKMPYFGEGRRKVLVVGEAPGAEEDKRGRPFVGEAGDRLRRHLRNVDVDLDRDCWTTNAAICRPPNNKLPDRAVDHCRPNLMKTIAELNPVVVVLLGGSAIKGLINHLWRDEPVTVGRWVGWRIPSQRLNAWVCPTYHPSYVMREDSQVVDLWFERHLRAAFRKTKRPWKEVPDYRKEVLADLNEYEVYTALTENFAHRDLVAFDYETNMLKPDGQESQIYSCSMSDGELTIAYPWHGDAIKATAAILKDKRVKKIASNMKFEDRWTRAKLGFHVRGWATDTMLAAHVLDNRPEISSIKFQSFVRLGFGSYDDHVSQYLKAKEPGGYAKNRIQDCDLNELLVYNGLDSLLEFKVAELQRKEIDDAR